MTRDQYPIAGVAIGVWAFLPKVAGPALNTADRVEFADHVVPAIVIVLASVTSFAVVRRSAQPGTALFVAGLLVALSGLWMTATHFPLLVQAFRDEVDWGAALFHSLPGLAVLTLGTLWSVRFWSEAAPPESGP